MHGGKPHAIEDYNKIHPVWQKRATLTQVNETVLLKHGQRNVLLSGKFALTNLYDKYALIW